MGTQQHQCLNSLSSRDANNNSASADTPSLSNNSRIHSFNLTRPHTPTPPPLHFHLAPRRRTRHSPAPILQILALILRRQRSSLYHCSGLPIGRLHILPTPRPDTHPSRTTLHPPRGPHSPPPPPATLARLPLYPLPAPVHDRIPARPPRPRHPDLLIFKHLSKQQHNAIHTHRENPGYTCQ